MYWEWLVTTLHHTKITWYLVVLLISIKAVGHNKIAKHLWCVTNLYWKLCYDHNANPFCTHVSGIKGIECLACALFSHYCLLYSFNYLSLLFWIHCHLNFWLLVEEVVMYKLHCETFRTQIGYLCKIVTTFGVIT